MQSENGPLLLTFDIGTTAVKVCLFSISGKLISLSIQEYKLITPAENIVELNPQTYWICCKYGAHELLRSEKINPKNVKSISICSQGETFVTLDKQGNPIGNAIVWLDNRSNQEAEEIRSELGVNYNTGQVDVTATWPATKLLWLKKNRQKDFFKIDRILLIEDYLIYKLSGFFIGDYALYSSSYMLDIVNKEWYHSLLNYIGIQEQWLPELVEPGTKIGTLTQTAAEELGLEKNTMLISGGMDQSAAVLGSGCIYPNMITETIGAAFVICATLDTFPSVPLETMSIQYHSIPDRYVQMGWCNAGGMNLTWLRNLFSSESYKEMDSHADRIEAGSQGLIYLPFLAGPGTLNIAESTRGIFYGAELHHTKHHFTRAVLEALGFTGKFMLQQMALTKNATLDIRSLGGGAQSSIWNQIRSDIINMPITTMQCSESASLGVAMLGASALGYYTNINEAVSSMAKIDKRYTPNQSKAVLYEDAYDKFKQILGLFNQKDESGI